MTMLSNESNKVDIIRNAPIWIVLPAYNEEVTIGQVLTDLCDKGYSVLVIDDCSTDKTLDIALQFPVIVLQHMINLGQGAALQTGFDFLLSHTTAKYVVTFDSDRQHNVEEIQLLLEPITTGNFDVALGTRFSKNTNQNRNINGMPFSKFLTLKVGVFYTRLTTSLNITDTHNGFRAFTINALRKIHITQNRMAHGSEILMQIAKNKFSYCEVPVSVVYTEYSKKKGQKVFNSLNILWDLIFGREE